MVDEKPIEEPRRDGVSTSPPAEDDGVDTSLIRWMLSLTPVERLQVLEENVRAIEELRRLNQP